MGNKFEDAGEAYENVKSMRSGGSRAEDYGNNIKLKHANQAPVKSAGYYENESYDMDNFQGDHLLAGKISVLGLFPHFFLQNFYAVGRLRLNKFCRKKIRN